MKVLRCLAALLSLSIILMLQGCGADTSGALTMTAPTSANNSDGSYSVSTTIKYIPADGKSTEGVKINIIVSDSTGVLISDDWRLTSGSNTVDYTIPKVNQLVGFSNYVTIVASIGGMKATVGTVIPGISALSAASIDFLAAEAVAPGTTKTTTISGGVGAYTLTSSGTVDGVLAISLADNILTVKYASVTTVALFTTQVTITDNVGNTLSIPVTYYK